MLLASLIHVPLCVPLLPRLSPPSHMAICVLPRMSVLVVRVDVLYSTPPLALLAWSSLEWVTSRFLICVTTRAPNILRLVAAECRTFFKCTVRTAEDSREKSHSLVRCSFVERIIVTASSQSSWRADRQVSSSVWFTIATNHRVDRQRFVRPLWTSGKSARPQTVDTLLKTSGHRRHSCHHRPRGRYRARRLLSLCLLLPLASPSTTAAAHLLQFLWVCSVDHCSYCKSVNQCLFAANLVSFCKSPYNMVI